MKNWVYPLMALSLVACSTPLPSRQPGDKAPVNAVDAPRNTVLLSASGNPAQQLLVPTPKSSALASPTVSAVPSAVPATPSPLTSPTPSPSVTFPPFADPDTDRRVIYRLQGRIFDLSGEPVSEARVQVDSQDPTLLFSQTTIADKEGYYKIMIPKNTKVKVIVKKEEYSERISILTPSNYTGPSLAILDFHFADRDIHFLFNSGWFYPNEPAPPLSKGPEVILANPVNFSQINPQHEIQLTFNKSIDKTSFEDAFYLFPRKIQLLADKSIPESLTQAWISDIHETTSPFPRYSSPVSQMKILWDKRTLDFHWNAEQTEVLIRFKPGYFFPSYHKKENSNLGYGISFRKSFSDSQGNLRTRRFFYHKQTGENNYVSDFSFFAISPDTILPTLSSLSAHPQGLSVEWSEQMLIPTLDIPVAGGMAARRNLVAEPFAPAEYPLAPKREVAANYALRWPTPEASPVSWQALGGRAVYDTTDIMYRRVLLKAPVNSSGASLAVIPALRWASTQALASAIQFDAQDNSSWQLGYRLVKADGGLSAQLLTPDLETESSTAEGLASALQTALNAPERSTALGSSANPWLVRLSPDQKQLELRFLDLGGQYIGWAPGESQIQLGIGDSLPSGMVASALQNWSQGQPFQWFLSGTALNVEVAPTVIDPAGNSVDPAQRNKSYLLP